MATSYELGELEALNADLVMNFSWTLWLRMRSR